MTIFESIQQAIKNKTGKTVTLDTNLREIGLDSLELLDFVIDLEKKLDIRLPDEDLGRLNTVKDVVDAVTHLQK